MTLASAAPVTGSEVRLRPVTDADAPALREVFALAWGTELAAAGLPAAQLEALLSVQYAGREQSRALYDPPVDDRAVVLGDAVIGRLVVQRAATAYLLVDVELLPAHRGGGIGTALLRDLLDEAAAAGVPVRLSVHATNAAALRLYTTLGFRVTGAHGAHLSMEWICR